ncbi:MAG: DUF72 domain-containing protein [Bacteroidales bacterium]|nr:MAG: DUF72 domain-containing protein [Bacteroidales bacterium]
MPVNKSPDKHTTLQLYIGTSGWTYDHWKNKFYPGDLAKTKWFTYYCKYFSTVEINATFYRRFKDRTYIKWKDRVNEKFSYVLKAPRIITHRKYLINIDDDIKDFTSSASLLGDKLGLILLQLAPRTKYNPELLNKTISLFSHPQKLAIEFRNKVWLNGEIYTILKESGAVYCNADSPKSSLNDWITADTAYIRLHGREKWYSYNYSGSELAEISSLVKYYSGKGIKRIYIFFNNDFEGYAPANALSLMELLGTG